MTDCPEFQCVFNGTGLFKDKLSPTVDRTVPPVQLPTRKIPVGIRGEVESELDKLVENSIIKKVDEATPCHQEAK